MAYVAYGFPVTFRLHGGGSDERKSGGGVVGRRQQDDQTGEEVTSASGASNHDGVGDVIMSAWSADCLLIVTTKSVQIWSAGQYRVCLGECKIAVGKYGRHEYATWSPSVRKIAVMVRLIVNE